MGPCECPLRITPGVPAAFLAALVTAPNPWSVTPFAKGGKRRASPSGSATRGRYMQCPKTAFDMENWIGEPVLGTVAVHVVGPSIVDQAVQRYPSSKLGVRGFRLWFAEGGAEGGFSVPFTRGPYVHPGRCAVPPLFVPARIPAPCNAGPSGSSGPSSASPSAWPASLLGAALPQRHAAYWLPPSRPISGRCGAQRIGSVGCHLLQPEPGLA